MRKIAQKFDEICAKAEAFNKEKKTDRFYKIYEQRKRFVTLGLYDSVTKKYALFDTVNLTGNFRYDNHTVPQELYDMERLVKYA
jgi:hypothetical protein